MKRILSVLLSLVIATAGLLTVSAAGAGNITVGSASGKPGEEIKITIKITNNPGIISLLLNLEYDKSVLTLTRVENGAVFNSSAASFGNKYDVSPYKMVWEDGLSSNNTKTGNLVLLTFRIADNAKNGKTFLNVSVDKDSTFDYDLKGISFSIEQGNIEIEGNKAQLGIWSYIKNIWKSIINFFKNIFSI